jgi:hypothetical protein
MTQYTPELGDNLLRGAKAIAGFVYGDEKMARKIFHLVATSRLPIFKLGSMICARRSVLLDWIKEQEQRHSRNNPPSGQKRNDDNDSDD